MSIARIYQAVPLALSQILLLDEKASHHVARVLRANIHDQLTLFNGQGGEFIATIIRIDKKNVQVNLIEAVVREAESPLTIELAQGIARGEKMDFIVQKAVELGVKKIVPLITERCNVRLDHEREEKRLQHWQSVLISACEQSGRNQLPELTSPISLQEWLAHVNAEHRLVLSPHAHERIPTIAQTARVALLIGPEGGLSDAEIKYANEHGFVALNIGPRILRTETATLAAVTLLQTLYGDMK